jgi:hypothetical protein
MDTNKILSWIFHIFWRILGISFQKFAYSHLPEIQSDSILLSGFPWPIIFKPYVSWKTCMLKLFSILQYWFYKQYNFLSYTFIFRKQFYSVPSDLKIIGHGNPNNNLKSPCTLWLNWSIFYWIWGAYCGDYEQQWFLGCDAVKFGDSPIFRRNISFQFSES